MGNKLDEIDKKLQRLKLPQAVTRHLRPLSEREYYKSYEWKYMLQFAAYPILCDFLPEKYVSS